MADTASPNIGYPSDDALTRRAHSAMWLHYATPFVPKEVRVRDAANGKRYIALLSDSQELLCFKVQPKTGRGVTPGHMLQRVKDIPEEVLA